jgi:hypothetical protein
MHGAMVHFGTSVRAIQRQLQVKSPSHEKHYESKSLKSCVIASKQYLMLIREYFIVLKFLAERTIAVYSRDLIDLGFTSM